MLRKSLGPLLSLVMGLMLVISGLLLALGPIPTYAATHIEVIGDEYGLVIEPTDAGLFKMEDMIPGDRVKGSFRIENKDRYAFNLYLKAEAGIGDVSLAKQIQFQANYKGEEIHNSNFANFANETIFLGKFNPGDVQNFTGEAYLPGETGNEYQKQSVSVKWIFTAQSERKDTDGSTEENHQGGDSTPFETEPQPVDPELLEVPGTPEIVPIDTVPTEPPNMPATGESIPVMLYAAGIGAILAGINLVFRKMQG